MTKAATTSLPLVSNLYFVLCFVSMLLLANSGCFPRSRDTPAHMIYTANLRTKYKEKEKYFVTLLPANPPEPAGNCSVNVKAVPMKSCIEMSTAFDSDLKP